MSETSMQKRYDEFLRVTRQYRHLMLCKRAGRGLDPMGIETTKPGELALQCPACPHPGKNLPDGWEKSAKQYVFFSWRGFLDLMSA